MIVSYLILLIENSKYLYDTQLYMAKKASGSKTPFKGLAPKKALGKTSNSKVTLTSPKGNMPKMSGKKKSMLPK